MSITIRRLKRGGALGFDYNAAESPDKTIELDVHKVMLGIKSSYFHKRLTNDSFNDRLSEGEFVLAGWVQEGDK